MSSTPKHLVITYIRIICRKYKVCIFLGLLIVFFQGYLCYYIYDIDENQEKPFVENRKLEKSVPVFPGYFSQYIKPQKISLISHSLDKHSEPALDFDNCSKENFGISCPCSLQAKDALSAIQRAKTVHCKQKIADVSCSIQNGTFFPREIKSLCPTDGHFKGKHLGCFIDDRANRILSGYVAQLKKNSPFICADLCLQRGYIYSGVEYSKECFCGNKEIPERLQVPDTECDMTCPGDLKKMFNCGGYLRISVVETGLAKITPHALRRPSANDGPTVRIAYILIVNGRALRQVHRLIRALYHKDHFFFIHVDLRQNYLYHELLVLETVYSNIFLSRRRFSSIWGGTSLLSVLLHCMSELLNKETWKWDFVINLSESDFPIKTNAMLVQFLTANKERNFLKSHGHDTNKFIKKQGLDRTFLECETHMWRIGERNLPLGIRMDGGSDWVCLTRQFVEYIGQNRDELVNGLLKFFSYTLLPGESFFHTVLRNSIFCQSFTDNNLHVTNWKRKLGCRCQYKHIVDWCGCSPNDFTLDDWPKIEAAKNRNLYFGRKFEPIINLKVINKIDQLLYGLYDTTTPNLKSYWENIYHHEDPTLSIDDVDLTIYHAAARLTQYALKNPELVNKFMPVNATTNSKPNENLSCEVIPSQILQSFSYKVNDFEEGLLIEFAAYSQSDKRNLILQSWMQPKILINIIRGETTTHRLKRVEVNSNLDLKEQVFRNHGRCLGPKSTIAIMTWWHASDEQDGDLKPRIILMDPVGAVAADIELPLTEEEQVVDHSFTLSTPLRPGVWKSFVIVANEIIATVEFAILPLQFFNGRQISDADSRSMHCGPSSSYSEINIDSVQGLIDGALAYPGNASLLKTADENSHRSGPALLEWIDQIFEKAYVLKGICHLPDEGPSCFKSLTFACPEVSWSSYSPDPKSFLGEVDHATGRLHDPYRVSKDS